MSRPPSGGPPLPASCCRLFHWISSSSRMMVCCFLNSCSVFWCFSARSCTQASKTHVLHQNQVLVKCFCESVWATNLCVIEVNRGYGETLFLIWWPLPHSYFCHLSIYVNKNVVWRLLKEFLSFSKYTCICRDHAHLILMQTESFYAINRPEIWEKWLSSEKSIKGYSYYAFKRGKDLT